MRIDRLDLLAFGCFTDRTFDFAAPGVHIVHGPNEAGKSTARVALTRLLYDFPTRSTHAFLHDSNKLLLGGLLRDDSGGTLEIIRRKGNKDVLRAPDGTVIPEGTLTRLLNGVGEQDFTGAFSLDHEQLRSGGEALLDSNGDVGKALFESRSSSRLAEVLATIDERSRELYLKGGRKPSINAGVIALKDLRRAVADAELAPRDYGDAEKSVEKAKEEQARLAGYLREALVHHSGLDRLRQALPMLLQRAALRERHTALLAEGPVVARSVATELEAATKRLSSARTEAERAKADLETVELKAAETVVDELLLAQGAAVDALYADGSAARAAREDAREAEEQAGQAEQRATDLLESVRPGRALAETEAYELPPGAADRLAALHQDLAVHDTALRDRRLEVDKRTVRLTAAQAASEAAPEPAEADTLRALLRSVPAGLVDESTDAERELAQLTDEADTVRARHGLPETPASRLQLPAVAQVDRHREQAAELRLHTGRLTEQRAGLCDKLDERRRDLEELLRSDPPPTDTELAEARESRDALFASLRTPEERQVYTEAVRAADAVADRIRRQAKDSARRVRLEVDVDRDQIRLTGIDDKLDAAAESEAALAAAWADLWAPSGLKVPEHEAAGDLLAAVGVLAGLETRIAAADQAATGRREEAARLTERFRTALAEAGAPTELPDLAGLVDLADLRIDALAEAVRRRDRAEQELRGAETELAEATAGLKAAEEERAAWQEQWTALVLENDLPDGEPEAVASRVATLAEVSRIARERTEAQERQARSQRRTADFDTRLAGVLTALGREPDGDGSVQAAELHAALNRARAAGDTRERLVTEAANLRHVVRDRGTDIAAASAELTALVEDAKVADVPSLRAAVDRTTDADALAARIVELEELLTAHGETLAALEAKAARWLKEPAELEVAVDEAAARVAELQGAYDVQNREFGRYQERLNAMDDSDRAAVAQEQAAVTLTDVVADAEQYVRLQLARAVLLRSMEEYRQSNQGTVLGRAEALFAALTGGRFDRLVTETEGKGGSPVLKARRAGTLDRDGEPALLDVTQMSEGTRDQLYLALRLASLERYAEAGRTMPVVLDDVAMTFDDGRTRELLRLLDSLADRFQILLFTHHRHLTGLAVETLGADRAHLHELPDSTTLRDLVDTQSEGVR